MRAGAWSPFCASNRHPDHRLKVRRQARAAGSALCGGGPCLFSIAVGAAALARCQGGSVKKGSLMVRGV